MSQTYIRWDNGLLETLEQFCPTTTDDTDHPSPRLVKRSDGRVGIIFELEDIKRIAMPHQWLSSGCINGCAALFQAMFSNQKDHALFSTYNITHIRNDDDDQVLWRNTRGTRFWKRRIWILPIHRERQSHWVLAIVQVADRRITLFDSFAQGSKVWSTDVKVVSV